MRKGALDPITKELIYVAVSITNSCEYCTKSHSFAAKKGATDEMLKEMIAVVGLANKNNKLVDSTKLKLMIFINNLFNRIIPSIPPITFDIAEKSLVSFPSSQNLNKYPKPFSPKALRH